jgi:hypothetical protein
LVSCIHEIIAKLFKATNQRGPGIIFRQEDNHLANFFYKNILSGKPELFGQPYRLASAVNEYFRSLHDAPPELIKYISRYIPTISACQELRANLEIECFKRS